tara:strand:+ start:7391 stop:8632 length:1242 start_codon:yes stop_codon:yes gene_type:complete
MSTDNKVVEIKTIDFNLVNLNNDATINCNTDLVLLENKIELIENKLNEQTETNEVILKKLNFDNLFSDQTNTLSVEVENLKKNVKDLTKKLEEAEIIRQIVDESISTIIDSKFKDQVTTSEEINKNILEVDLIVKENRMELNNLKSNIQNIIEKEIEDVVQNDIDNIIESTLNDKINELLEENNKKIIDSVSEIIYNKINKKKAEEEAKRIMEEQKNAEEATLATEEQNKTSEDTHIIEQQNMANEEIEAKHIMEEQKKAEEAMRIMEEQKKAEEATRIMEEQKKADEEKKLDDELLKVANEDVIFYPTTGYTMYLFMDTNFDLNLSSVLVFISKDNKYELRAKTNIFKTFENRSIAILNIQLDNNEDSFLIRLHNGTKLIKPANDIYSNFDNLVIGKNNLTNNILDIPMIKF